MKLTNLGKSRLYKFFGFLAYLIPMALLFIFNIDNYKTDGSIFGFWGIVILVMILVMFKRYLLSFFGKYTRVSIGLGLFAIGIFSRYVGEHLALIGIVSFFASLISFYFDLIADIYERHAYKIIDGEKIVKSEIGMTFKAVNKEFWGGTVADITESESK